MPRALGYSGYSVNFGDDTLCQSPQQNKHMMMKLVIDLMVVVIAIIMIWAWMPVSPREKRIRLILDRGGFSMKDKPLTMWDMLLADCLIADCPTMLEDSTPCSVEE